MTMSRLLALMTVLLCYLMLRVSSERMKGQYCHANTAEEPVAFCVTASTWYNESTQATDLALIFGHQRSPRGGWAAVGLGEGMFGALMFITYAQASPGNKLVISVRAGKGHFEPRPSHTLPEVKTKLMTLNESAWLEANFICYGCASWTPRPVESTVQHWIWAYNSVQRMERASEQSTLAAHENWGVFDMDINGQWDNPPNRAVIHTGPEKASSSWAGLHGSILAVSIMLLYPCGAFAMWGKSGNALKTHLFQIPASIGCFVGGAIAVYATAKNGPIGFREPHVLLGSTLLLVNGFQLALGHFHHQAVKLSRRTPWVTKCHKWLGRFIVLGGCVNVLIGLHLAGTTTPRLAFAISLTVVDLALVTILSCKAPVQPETVTEQCVDNDLVTPFLPTWPEEEGNEMKAF